MLKDFTKIPFDILVQAGQSNASGAGSNCLLLKEAEAYQPEERVYYLDQNGIISVAAERVSVNQIFGDFSLSFARKYLQTGLLADGRSLLIVRAAVGGTGFQDQRWGLRDDLYLQLLEMTRDALAMHPENKLKALLWHQGENDCGSASKETHIANLSNLVQGFRNTFGCPALPLIAGDFVPQWVALNPEHCAPIQAAMRNVCEKLQPAGFVESTGLLSNDEAQSKPGDTIHFCREALYQLGERYFAEFSKL